MQNRESKVSNKIFYPHIVKDCHSFIHSFISRPKNTLQTNNNFVYIFVVEFVLDIDSTVDNYDTKMSGNLVINNIFSEFQKSLDEEQEIREVTISEH